MQMAPTNLGCKRPQIYWTEAMDKVAIETYKDQKLSRNKTWKNKLADIKVLIGLSEFGWDPINYTMTADKESRKKLKLHKVKKFKDYEVLLELMGDEGGNGDNMRSVGHLIDKEDIVDDLDDIDLLKASLKDRIKPSVDVLKTFFNSDSDVLTVLKRSTYILQIQWGENNGVECCGSAKYWCSQIQHFKILNVSIQKVIHMSMQYNGVVS
ncbi:hypothetical protein GIB67_027717 [Kingdonia uniflora]|uniref:Myb/SANT-like domain-containing protein n=1 Tax=Kingdonia uniflora TaxID=39325 RepID=A0A7J7NL30_9MAGN|nr:hypothetical protein GIB67_027717 [Kingdonia uniflora]